MKTGWPHIQRPLQSKNQHPTRFLGTLALAWVILCLAFLSAAPAQARGSTAHPQSVSDAVQQVTPKPGLTPTPGLDIINNRNQTTGIIVGSIFLVLIIVIGTLVSERSLKNH
jgi:hypothetical protein